VRCPHSHALHHQGRGDVCHDCFCAGAHSILRFAEGTPHAAHPVAQATKVLLAGPVAGEAAADQVGSALLASLAVPRSPSLTIAVIRLESLSSISPILFRLSPGRSGGHSCRTVNVQASTRRQKDAGRWSARPKGEEIFDQSQQILSTQKWGGHGGVQNARYDRIAVLMSALSA
jgi:hypothetical protein